ncbi:hypothetical protein [Streptomyces endophyticus]|uniref:Uncharacterized protein n=1 Tax=Streptomyces endophyticus TaxID=714166 RepID=A0ABU6F237_9ACTN|nr:hypothetical protein [Streptomyces endophyticus]MEB8338064.1 hypothetical protein [Streptomyces endophyticus]
MSWTDYTTSWDTTHDFSSRRLLRVGVPGGLIYECIYAAWPEVTTV